MAKSDIKLYGKITNGDGNLLVSPLEIAGVNIDGSIPTGKATDTNNIISYINSKTGNVKTGIKYVTFSNTLLTDTYGEKSQKTTLTVACNDGTSDTATLNIEGEKIVKGATIEKGTKAPLFGHTTTLATLKMNKWVGTDTVNTIDITLPDNNAVGEAWDSSQTAKDYKKSVTDAIGTAKTEVTNTASADATSKSNKALTDAKKYTDEQIGMKLGKVYKPQGNANLTTIVTINPSTSAGNVWNMTEEFKIDGHVYPQYTNIVIVDGVKATTLKYDTKQGFSGDVVDALGGMIDQTAIQDSITKKFEKTVIGISTPATAVAFNPITGGDITQSITYTLGNNTPGTFDIKLHNDGASANIKAVNGKKDIVSKVTVTKKDAVFTLSYAGIKTDGTPLDCTQSIDFKATSTTYGMVKAGDNVKITDTGIINVPSASTTLGVVKTSSTSSVSITDGLLDIKLAADSGISKSTTGELSIPKNTFTAGTGIDIKKTGNDFSVGFNTTYVSDAASPAGQPLYYNKTKNGFYVNTDSNLSVTTDTDKSTKISINTATLKSTLGVNSKADTSTVTALSGRVDKLEAALPKKADSSALAALTSRVEALESLLSLG